METCNDIHNCKSSMFSVLFKVSLYFLLASSCSTFCNSWIGNNRREDHRFETCNIALCLRFQFLLHTSQPTCLGLFPLTCFLVSFPSSPILYSLPSLEPPDVSPDSNQLLCCNIFKLITNLTIQNIIPCLCPFFPVQCTTLS